MLDHSNPPSWWAIVLHMLLCDHYLCPSATSVIPVCHFVDSCASSGCEMSERSLSANTDQDFWDVMWAPRGPRAEVTNAFGMTGESQKGWVGSSWCACACTPMEKQKCFTVLQLYSCQWWHNMITKVRGNTFITHVILVSESCLSLIKFN